MAFTTINKGNDFFNPLKYTGNSSTQSITGVGFSPNWVWIKSMGSTDWQDVTDTVRGNTKSIYPSETSMGDTVTNSITSFADAIPPIPIIGMLIAL